MSSVGSSVCTKPTLWKTSLKKTWRRCWTITLSSFTVLGLFLKQSVIAHSRSFLRTMWNWNLVFKKKLQHSGIKDYTCSFLSCRAKPISCKSHKCAAPCTNLNSDLIIILWKLLMFSKERWKIKSWNKSFCKWVKMKSSRQFTTCSLDLTCNN